MLSKSLLPLAACLALLPAQGLSFYIFIGADNAVSEGGQGSVNTLNLFNNRPNCDEAIRAVNLVNNDNDATKNGWAADGIRPDANPPDWELTRLEINNEPNASGTRPVGAWQDFFTLYTSNGFTWRIESSDEGGANGRDVGTCSSPDKGEEQFVDCTGGFGATKNSWEVFKCTTWGGELIDGAYSPN